VISEANINPRKNKEELDVAIAVICQLDTYLMERRTDEAKGATGLIGCFGGLINAGETPIVAVQRELVEETSLVLEEAEFALMGVVKVLSDRNHQPVIVNAHVFKTTMLPYGLEVIVTNEENELIAMPIDEIADKLDRLTPATRAAFEKFVLKDLVRRDN
jgi:8-oxo-dGTP pyrophosphatase MutT (NUDIX family)